MTIEEIEGCINELQDICVDIGRTEEGEDAYTNEDRASIAASRVWAYDRLLAAIKQFAKPCDGCFKYGNACKCA